MDFGIILGLKNEIYSPFRTLISDDSMASTFPLVTQFPFLLLQDLFYTLSILPVKICVINHAY